MSAGQDGDLHFWSLEDGVLVNTYEGKKRKIYEFITGRKLFCAYLYRITNINKNAVFTATLITNIVIVREEEDIKIRTKLL